MNAGNLHIFKIAKYIVLDETIKETGDTNIRATKNCYVGL